MPKVSQDYTDAQRAQILAAAQRCFLRDGFHETSMQDLFKEAGLSSGAVYRHFPSKEALIIAFAEDNMRDNLDTVREVAKEGRGRPVGEVLSEVLELIHEKNATTGFAPLVVMVWGEALRNPELGDTLKNLFKQLRAELTTIVREHQAAGTLPADVPARSLAGALFDSLAGHMVQLAVLGPRSVSGTATALRALWSQASVSASATR